MENSKLLKLISLLNNREMNKLARFLQSPYFNRNPLCVQLFDYIRAGLKTKQAEKRALKLLKKNVLASAFDKNITDSYFKRVVSELKRLVELFFSMERFQTQQFQVKLHFFEELMDRNALDYISPIINNLTTLPKKEQQNANAFYEAYQKELFYYKFHHSMRRSKNEEGPLPILQALDQFYFLIQANYLCEVNTRSEIFTTTVDVEERYELLFPFSKLDHIPQNSLSNLYFSISQLYKSRDKVMFQQLKQQILRPSDLPKNSWKELSTLLENYCVEHWNMGEVEYLEDLHELYKAREENGLLLERGVMNEMVYKNIIVLGLFVNKKEWIKAFMDAYKEKLPPDKQDKIYQLCRCLLFFHEKKYAEIITLTEDISFRDDLLLEVQWRHIRLKAFYELGTELQKIYPNMKEDLLDFFNRKCNTYTTFLSRREVSKNIQRSYSAHANILSTLFEIREYIQNAINPPQSQKTLFSLQKRISEQYDFLSDKQYIKGKIEELLNSMKN